MKIRPEGAELFHAVGQADGQTDMMTVIVYFRKNANIDYYPIHDQLLIINIAIIIGIFLRTQFLHEQNGRYIKHRAIYFLISLWPGCQAHRHHGITGVAL